MNPLDAAETRTVDLDGTRLQYYVDGPEDAGPVVLVHGGGIDSAALSWQDVFPALAEEHRVYALDLPGYGESGGVPDGTTPDTDYYADVLGGFFETLDVLDATLVGASMGGAVALDYVFASPARVSRLAIVAGFGLDDEPPGGRPGTAYVKTPLAMEGTWWALARNRRLTARALRGIVHPENVDEALVDDAVRELRRPNAGDAHRRYQRAEVDWSGPRTSFADRMDVLPVQTLFVHGEDDPLVPTEHAKRASDAAPVADRFFLAECGHLPQREHPEAFVARLQAWLERT